MKYVSIKEKANEWEVSERQVQYYCQQLRIEGAFKQSGVWLVPADATNPSLNNIKNLRLLSLFSGCGGMDLGFEGFFSVFKKQYNKRIHPNWKIKELNKNQILLPKTRFSTVFANDIKPEAKTAWTDFFSTKKSIYCLDSIVDLVKLQKNNSINIFPENIDIVIGGFPCQDFSIAGKRLGFKSKKSHLGIKTSIDEPCIENRGNLYIWMREVISITEPKVFVAENVKGLTNLGDAQKIIEADFSRISNDGYFVFPARILHAARYGVAQNRERVIFIGLRKNALKPGLLEKIKDLNNNSELDPYPIATHSDNNVPGLLPYVKLKDILGDLDEPEHSKDVDQQRFSKAKFMGKHCQGQTEINLNSISPTIRAEHHGNIEFRRLSKENGGINIKELESGLKERRLTLRECARIQSFPNNYQFYKPGKCGVSSTEAYKMIGNALPPLMAFHIASRLEELWPIYFGE